MSALEALFAVLDARLAAIAGVQRYERMPTGDPDRFPALQLYDDGDRPGEDEVYSDRRTLGVTIEGFVEGEGGAAVHAELTALHAAVVAAVMSEPPLGGLAEIVTQGERRVDLAPLAKKRRLGFAQDFEIQYATVRGDPSTFA